MGKRTIPMAIFNSMLNQQRVSISGKPFFDSQTSSNINTSIATPLWSIEVKSIQQRTKNLCIHVDIMCLRLVTLQIWATRRSTSVTRRNPMFLIEDPNWINPNCSHFQIHTEDPMFLIITCWNSDFHLPMPSWHVPRGATSHVSAQLVVNDTSEKKCIKKCFMFFLCDALLMLIVVYTSLCLRSLTQWLKDLRNRDTVTRGNSCPLQGS